MKLKLLLTSNDFRKTKSSWVRKMIIVLHSYSFRTEVQYNGGLSYRNQQNFYLQRWAFQYILLSNFYNTFELLLNVSFDQILGFEYFDRNCAIRVFCGKLYFITKYITGMNIFESRLHNIKYALHYECRNNLKKEKTNFNRRQLIKCLDEKLMVLIQKSQAELNYDILEDLIRYANNESQNAIIQIGNLILDNKEVGNYVKDKLIPGSNEYWCWLVRILISTCDNLGNEGLDWILKIFLSKNISQIAQSNIMEILSEITEHEGICSVLSMNKNFLQKLCTYALSTIENTYTLAFKILANLVSINDYITMEIIRNLQTKLTDIIKIGLLKSQSKVRLLSCEILSNLSLNGYIPLELVSTILLKSVREKNNIIEQISYFLKNVSEICQFEVLQEFFSKGLVSTLTYYLTQQKEYLEQNGTKIVRNILRRVRLSNDRESFANLYKLLENNNIINLMRKIKEKNSDQFSEENTQWDIFQ